MIKKECKEEQLAILQEFDNFDNNEVFKPLEIFEDKHFTTLLNKIKHEGYSEDLYQECSKDQSLQADIIKNYTNHYIKSSLYKSRDIGIKTLNTHTRDIKTPNRRNYPLSVKHSRNDYLNLDISIDDATFNNNNRYSTPDRKRSNKLLYNNHNNSYINHDNNQRYQNFQQQQQLYQQNQQQNNDNSSNSCITNGNETIDQDKHKRLFTFKVDNKYSNKDLGFNSSTNDDLKTLSPKTKVYDSYDSKDIIDIRKTRTKFNTIIEYFPKFRQRESSNVSQKGINSGNNANGGVILDKTKYQINIKDSNIIRLFKKISCQEKLTTSAIKFPRELLRNYYSKRYPLIIAEKLMSTLDFPSIIDYKIYIDTFNNLINKNIYGAYYLAFKIYDINNDGYICHRDVFQIFKLRDHFTALNNDFDKFHHFQGTTANTFTSIGVSSINTMTANHMQRKSKNEKIIISNNVNFNPTTAGKAIQPTSSAGIKKEKINLTKIWYAKDEGLSVITKLESGNDIAQKYKNIYELSLSKHNHNHNKANNISFADKAILPLIPNTNKISSYVMQANEFLKDDEKQSNNNNIMMITNENNNTNSSNTNKIDLIKFRELFDDDIPYIIYDIIYVSIFVNLYHKPLLITPNDIFKSFENQIHKQKIFQDYN